MPRGELIDQLQRRGLPVTVENEQTGKWTHSPFYIRAWTSGIEAAVKLADEQRIAARKEPK